MDFEHYRIPKRGDRTALPNKVLESVMVTALYLMVVEHILFVKIRPHTLASSSLNNTYKMFFTNSF